jgi:hypothetical protein
MTHDDNSSDLKQKDLPPFVPCTSSHLAFPSQSVKYRWTDRRSFVLPTFGERSQER